MAKFTVKAKGRTKCVCVIKERKTFSNIVSGLVPLGEKPKVVLILAQWVEKKTHPRSPTVKRTKEASFPL